MHIFQHEVHGPRWAKFFAVEAQDRVMDAMRDSLASIAGGYCMILCTLDGQQVARVTSRDSLNASRLAAITGSFCGLGETLGKELGQQDFRDVCVQTSTGIAVVQRIPPPGHRMVLLTAASADATLGLVSSQARYCAETISKSCFPIAH